MDMKRLDVILCETTGMMSKVEGIPENRPELERVDCHYCAVAVDKNKAAGFKEELHRLMKEYPVPNRLNVGPSYIELAGTLFEGDNERAFRLMALGKVLGFWTVTTPETLGISGTDADRLAFHGSVLIEDCKV